ncbi:hypothetical protein MKX01_005350 [Papaver californicum]|nr:hypothetical protein MKX01_005350 [Papaver californicum]
MSIISLMILEVQFQILKKWVVRFILSFVNNYFGGLNSEDSLHPQKYKKTSEQQSQQSGVEKSGAKGKEVVIYDGEDADPPSNQDGDISSSDSESEGVTEVQGHENQGPDKLRHMKKNPWYNRIISLSKCGV